MSNNYSEYGKAVFDMIAEERPLQAKIDFIRFSRYYAGIEPPSLKFWRANGRFR